MFVAESERLLLRTLEETDIDDLLKVWGDPEVMRFCGGAGDRERELRALKFYMKHQEEKGFSPYGIILKETGELIGVSGFNPAGDGYDAELMYHLAKAYWGMGYASEAVNATLDYSKKDLPFKCIEASIDPDNHASGKILENNGFKLVGHKWCNETQKEEPFYRLHL